MDESVTYCRDSEWTNSAAAVIFGDFNPFDFLRPVILKHRLHFFYQCRNIGIIYAGDISLVYSACPTSLVTFYISVCKQNVVFRCDYIKQICKSFALSGLLIQFIENILHIEIFIVS